MSRTLFSQARTGRRARSSNFNSIDTLKWNVGESKRITIPLYTDKQGKKGVVIFGQTVHHVDYGIIQLPKKNGGTYSTHTFRCSHPYSQQNFEDAVKVAERREMCVLCEYEKLQNTRRIGIMEKEFGTEENNYEDWGENFKNLTKEEKKKFYESYPINVQRSYYLKETDDGETYNVQNTELYLLVYDIEVQEVEKRKKVQKTGKIIKVKEYEPVLDKDGKVVYKPALMKVSEKRLDAFKNAVDTALGAETISYENLHTYIENEGTEFEEEVNVGWIDFELKFPKKEGKTARMESARDMTIVATVDSKSIMLNSEGLLERMEETIEKDYQSTKSAFENVYKNLQLYTRDEQLALLDPEIRGEFEQLREEFRTKEDEEFEQEVYDKVLNAAQNNEDSEDKTETESTNDSKSSTNKEESRGRKTVKEKDIDDIDDEEDLDDVEEETDADLDIDEEELFDE